MRKKYKGKYEWEIYKNNHGDWQLDKYGITDIESFSDSSLTEKEAYKRMKKQDPKVRKATNKTIFSDAIMLRVAVANEVKVAKEFATKEELMKYLESHPKADKTRHTVNPSAGKKAPLREKLAPKNIKKNVKEKAQKVKDVVKDKAKKVKEVVEKGTEEEVGQAKDLVGGLKNLSTGAKEALSNLPKKTREAIVDPKKRNSALKSAGQKLLKSSKKFGKKVVKDFVHEMKDAGGGIKKILKGEKPSKHEMKAMAVVAVDIGAAVAIASGIGAWAAAGYTGKSLVKHAVLTAVNPLIGDAYIISKGIDLAMKLAKEDKEYTDEQLTAIWTQAVIEAVAKKMEEGMTDEETAQALNGEFPKIDLTNIEFGEDDEQTD